VDAISHRLDYLPMVFDDRLNLDGEINQFGSIRPLFHDDNVMTGPGPKIQNELRQETASQRSTF
jgi:spore maturation protein CgeB